MRTAYLSLLSFLCSATLLIFAQQPSPTPAIAANSDPIYRQLRNVSVTGDAVAVSGLTLNRDAARFRLDGTLTFVAPVDGKITGAVFTGQGTLTIDTPLPEENLSLSLLTKGPEFVERFHNVVFRFTDGTEAEVRRAGKPAAADPGAGRVLADAQDAARHKLHWNLSARILQDLLNPPESKLFVAFVYGTNYSKDMVFVMDPFGVSITGEAEYSQIEFPEVAPEEIALLTYDPAKFGVWTAFHYASEYKDGTARGTQQNSAFVIKHQNLDTTIEKNGYLRGDALTTISARVAGLRAVRFALFPQLRVGKVLTGDGQPLEFIQEDKKEDPQYWVILPKPLNPDESTVIHTVYEGKGAVSNEGGGNYYPVAYARDDWYPNDRFGQYATYELKFRIPKNMTMLSTGSLVHEGRVDDFDESEWKTDVPIAVAGFNFGQFKRAELDFKNPKLEVTSYANVNPPDWVEHLKIAAEGGAFGLQHPELRGMVQSMDLGSMNTTMFLKQPLAEAQAAIPLYTGYFGPTSYPSITLTQQTACSFGQSWPELVYLPICSFFDNTVRHELGIGDISDHGYWSVVTPHEIAHQWWGHTVGFSSYRDQWMSEGFAHFSAALYLQLTRKDPHEFLAYWHDQRLLLTNRNKEGHRAIDVGPVTLGYRLANSRAGYNVPQDLIYPKGAFILHMLRMMMWNPEHGDTDFQAMMHDFVDTYRNRDASTEDFKAIVEKHMTRTMDLDHNHRMDWFFNEYVYGTALPAYKVDFTVHPGAAGAQVDFRVTQSNVNDSFRMIVPVYVEFDNGHVTRLGQVSLYGNRSFEKSVPVRGKGPAVKRILVNYYDDVLAAD